MTARPRPGAPLPLADPVRLPVRRAWGPGTGRWVCTAAREPGVAAVVLETTGEGPRSERKAASVVRPGVLPWPRGRDVSSTGATVVSVAVEQGSQSCTAPQWFPSRRGLRASGLSLQVGPGSPVLAGPAQAYRWGPAGLGQPSLGSLGAPGAPGAPGVPTPPAAPGTPHLDPAQ